ncbi:6-pyruvoyl tetrahydrobiopterin synthase [Aureococcus anophagefferens]|nr:6-pyruvoyl tetrahydrobiopterin synthase [Aureococcus anophagefferens]
MQCVPCDYDPVFEVQVRSERFKFNASHFVAFRGFRERLHGHNYTVGVRVFGPLSPDDGYVLDFGDVKKTLTAEDGAFFSIPLGDCAMLPIVHSTAEELAAMIWHKTIEAFGVDILKKRGITAIEIAVAEAPMQEARYRRKLAGFAPGAAPIPAPNAGCGANITPAG